MCRKAMSALGCLLLAGGWEVVRPRCDPAAALLHVGLEPEVPDAARCMEDRFELCRNFDHPHQIDVPIG